MQGRFPPGPEALRLVTPKGRAVTVEYSSFEHVPADVNGPAGMQFTADSKDLYQDSKDPEQAVERAKFPFDAMTAEALAYPVLSVAPRGRQAKPQTLNPTPYTLNSAPYTLNPQPCTINPEH